MKRLTAALSAMASIGAVAIAGPTTQVEASNTDEPAREATFEGQTFNMADGWGTESARPEIQVCHVTSVDANCYRSEREMNDAIGSSPAQRSARCSSSLRLYDGANKTGAVLSLATRGTVLSLSTYGFNNRTTSYSVGACSSRLYSGIGIGTYGGNTSAYASANSMQTGWNNVVSSVLIF